MEEQNGKATGSGSKKIGRKRWTRRKKKKVEKKNVTAKERDSEKMGEWEV